MNYRPQNVLGPDDRIIPDPMHRDHRPSPPRPTATTEPGIIAEYHHASANLARLDMMRAQIDRIRKMDPAARTPADLALLTEAAKVADRATAELINFTRAHPHRATPGVETRQAAAPAPGAVPFPGPLASRCGRLTLEGLTATFPVIEGTVTATTVAEGADKPLSAVTVTQQTTRAQAVVAAIGPIARTVLADTDATRRLDAAARRAVSVAVDSQVANALAANPQVPNVTAATVAEAIRTAIYQLQATGHATVTVAGPAALLGTVDPATLGAADIIAVADTAAGIIAADLSAAVGLATRGRVDVFTSDTVGDAFTRNEVYVVGEAMASAVVTDPGAARRIAVADASNGDDGTATRTAPRGKKAP